VKLTDAAALLDTFFGIANFPPDLPFSRLVPSVYADTGLDLEAHLEGSFLDRFHGLMLRNSGVVRSVCTAVFLSDEVVGKVVASAEPDVLLVCHHPLVMETSGRGFLPLSAESLTAMRDLGVSVYVLHTPLDVHDELSVSGALARDLGVTEKGRFHNIGDGYAGVYGTLSSGVELGELVERISEVTQVPDVHFIENRAEVRSVAVLGGGLDAEGILEVEALNCDALVTGTYLNLVQTEIGRRYREEFERIRDRLTISLVECSHYASEAVVMRNDMVNLCSVRLGMPCEFVPQDDPWY
jgi:putative NIF3 family GTP cyclohydrolase 1 type 2